MTNDLPEAESQEGLAPIDPKSYKWQPGSIVSIKTVLNTGWCPITFNLTLVKPVTFEELRDLVTHALRESLKDQHKNLFSEWYREAAQLKLVDVGSFEKAQKDAQAKSN